MGQAGADTSLGDVAPHGPVCGVKALGQTTAFGLRKQRGPEPFAELFLTDPIAQHGLVGTAPIPARCAVRPNGPPGVCSNAPDSERRNQRNLSTETIGGWHPLPHWSGCF